MTPEEQLKFEELKIENALLRQNVEYLGEHIKRSLELHYGFSDETMAAPHYLTGRELKLFRMKGIEALYIDLKTQIANANAVEAKKHGVSPS